MKLIDLHKKWMETGVLPNENGLCTELTGEAFQEYIYSKYLDLTFDAFSQDDLKKYSDVIQQLRYVRFKEKLFFVLMHYKKLDKQKEAL